MKSIASIAFFICFLASPYAQALSAKVLYNQKTVNLPIKMTFITVEEVVKAAVLMIALPLDGAPTGATGDGVSYNPAWQKKPGKVLIGLGRLLSTVTVNTAAGEQVYKVKVQYTGAPLFENGCATMGIRVKSLDFGKLPFFVGMKCEKAGEKETLHLSVPGELEWDRNDLFEIAGKGERWKMFDLTQVGTNSEGKTRFGFRYKDKSFPMEIQRDKEQGKVEVVKENFFNLRVGLGFAQLSYTTPLASAGATSPLLYTDITTLPYVWNMRALSALMFAMPLSGQQHYNLLFATGPQFSLGSSALLLLGEYIATGQDESETSTSFSHSQMGVGFKFIMKTGSVSNLSIHASYSGLGGDSTHTGVRLHYEQQGSKHTWGGLLSCDQNCSTGTAGNNGIGNVDGDGGGAPRHLCQLPWRGGVVTHKTRVTAYSRMSVTAGQK